MAKTREEQLKANRAYYLADPDRWLRNGEKHREKIRNRTREWREANPSKDRDYRQANPDKVRSYKHNRRCCLAGLEGTWTDAEWDALTKKYGNCCLRCGQKTVSLTPDHVIPVSGRLGVSNNFIGNIQPLCHSCNSEKSDLHATDYRLNPHPNCLLGADFPFNRAQSAI